MERWAERGGKSRAICEKALQYAMQHPGIQILICRQSHTSIVETTRKTMFQYVLPPQLIAKVIKSGGEDYVDLHTPEKGVTSRINFIGLDDPGRWFSAEIGVLIVDQVEECEEGTIVQLMTRLRGFNAPVSSYTGNLGLTPAEVTEAVAAGCCSDPPDTSGLGEAVLVKTFVENYPLAGKVILSFNPREPGHWLLKWFFEGGQKTATGFQKDEMYATDADYAFGDSEFFFAKATDNPHLPSGYVSATLAGLPPHLRRRYLDGIWEFISGHCYFDIEALGYYQQVATDASPLLNGHTVGDPHKDAEARFKGRRSEDPIKLRRGDGPWSIWKKPVPEHRYVCAVDVSSGGSTDYSAIQVICVEDFEQVAEYQGKTDPDLVGVEAYRIGRIYNNALIVPEVTGGWGFSVEQELKRLRYPHMFTKRVLDRLSKKWTDRTGWDTTVKTRAHMLDTLERVIRERELGLYSLRAVVELGTFVRDDAGRPAAQPGTNDDLVVALAIAVTVASDQPRQLRKLKPQPHRPAVSSVTGY